MRCKSFFCRLQISAVCIIYICSCNDFSYRAFIKINYLLQLYSPPHSLSFCTPPYFTPTGLFDNVAARYEGGREGGGVLYKKGSGISVRRVGMKCSVRRVRMKCSVRRMVGMKCSLERLGMKYVV